MAGLKALVSLAFLASLGVMFLILACALPQYNNWWPFFVIIFYLLAPVPNLFARRVAASDGGSNGVREFCWFLTTGLVVSAFGLPIVLAISPWDNPVIKPGAAGLVIAGNFVTFANIFGFILLGDNDDVEYSM